jgi:hypothetical protein
MNQPVRSLGPALAILCAAAATTPAGAQGVDGQAGFSYSVPPTIPSNSEPSATIIEVDPVVAGSLHTIQLLCGGFGGTHLGLLSWVGDITLSDPLGGSSLVNAPYPLGLRHPYHFGDSQGVNDGTSITGIDANRSAFQEVPWPEGEPMPQPELFLGIDSWDDIYRVRVVLTDFTPRDIVVNAEGTATFITSWGICACIVGWQPFVSFAVAGITTDQANASITLRIIPAPGAVVLLGIGGLIAIHRRRA